MQTPDPASTRSSAKEPSAEAVPFSSRIASKVRSDSRASEFIVTTPHPLLCAVRKGDRVALIASAAVWERGREVLRPFSTRLENSEASLILLGDPGEPADPGVFPCALLTDEPTPLQLHIALRSAFDLLENRARAESRGKWLNRYRYELGELIEIARAIEEERDIDKLLGLILEKSRFITGADAGSIYVVETDPGTARQVLRFKLSQNDSVKFDSREFTMPLSPRSMAGASAIHREAINIVDVYELPSETPFGFDRSFDQKTGYRTKSILCIPLVARSNEVIGVIQLINKKREPEKRLRSIEDVNNQVIAFDERSQELLSTLAAQAGISLENALLLEEIRRIFEGFVHASVEAIEQRDPTTSGHSRRVSRLTVELAKAVERVDTGPYREALFSAEDLREIEYASLLHDFGKIGVREQVLVKAKKLYDPELRLLRQRLELAIRSAQVDVMARKLRAIESGASGSSLQALDRELEERRSELEQAWTLIESANEPTVLQAGDFTRIEGLGQRSYFGLDGREYPLLTAEEITSLSVTRGSLTAQEIEEIRSHVRHTFDFLSTIPWGRSFRRVPLIAGAHHERLNGTGYPNRLRGEEIPLQSKLMSISDIFDALTASDRPYKRAVPVDKALDILGYEVRDQHLDGELVRIFRESRVWEK